MAISNKLTDLKIRQAIPSNKVSKLSDGRGMYLLLHPNGSKYWRMDFRHQGKQKTLALGIWPEVSLREAREKRDKAKSEIFLELRALKGNVKFFDALRALKPLLL